MSTRQQRVRDLFIPVGVPGCGKSSYRQTHYPHANVVSTDAIRKDLAPDKLLTTYHAEYSHLNFWVFAQFHQNIYSHLRADRSRPHVYADATNLLASARRDLRSLATLCNANTHLILFTNLEDAIENNRARNEKEEEHDAWVPLDAMNSMVEQYKETLKVIGDEPYDTVTIVSNFNIRERNDDNSKSDSTSAA